MQTTDLPASAASLFSHVTPEKTGVYRAVMEIFAAAKRQFRLHLRPDEVLVEARWPGERPSLEEVPAVELDTSASKAIVPPPEAPPAVPAASSEPSSLQNPWAPLLSAGLKLIETLAAASRGNGSGGESPNHLSQAIASWIERDAGTGRSYIKLPVPDPQAMQQLGAALSHLVAGLTK